MWQLLYQCAFLKKHQNWWIFVRHFNIDDGRKNIFSILCFIISRKVKMQLKHTHKKFVQCMKKVLWLIECVKSGFQSFVLEISHWMTFHSQVDQWSWQQSNTIMESNECYTNRRQPTYSKYPNQALKSICNSLVMLKCSESHWVLSDFLWPQVL